ncbi:hypothetical protein PR003_g5902 [Phytophthora rubi]|uniref:Uncharacterized protein n=1 Tax=Phytophthora rubi TaxID=129364 RepID=A0A6A4FIA9_9STRA|nr:hypothetical protein PR003_g5902 [Phytophthora rubi]
MTAVLPCSVASVAATTLCCSIRRSHAVGPRCSVASGIPSRGTLVSVGADEIGITAATIIPVHGRSMLLVDIVDLT